MLKIIRHAACVVKVLGLRAMRRW